MPVYEYLCTKGHAYEKTEGFSAPVTQKCTQCGARARRQISMPSVIFKGSGFYSTDNRGSEPPRGDGSSSTSTDNDKDRTKTDNGKASTKSDNGKASAKSNGAGSTDSASKTEAAVD